MSWTGISILLWANCPNFLAEFMVGARRFTSVVGLSFTSMSLAATGRRLTVRFRAFSAKPKMRRTTLQKTALLFRTCHLSRAGTTRTTWARRSIERQPKRRRDRGHIGSLPARFSGFAGGWFLPWIVRRRTKSARADTGILQPLTLCGRRPAAGSAAICPLSHRRRTCSAETRNNFATSAQLTFVRSAGMPGTSAGVSSLSERGCFGTAGVYRAPDGWTNTLSIIRRC